MPTGFILINKPLGLTSHQVVARLRRITGVRKIGHAGTLDPLATGLMVLAVGREATRRISAFVKLDKVYVAEMQLGMISPTYDLEVEPAIVTGEAHGMGQADIERVLGLFCGPQKQLPPMHSAKKVGGRKLYHLARSGQEIEREPADITVYYNRLISFTKDMVCFETKVSSGTYIRTLVHDIGQKLGCGAVLTGLERTGIGQFGIGEATSLEQLENSDWSEYLFDPAVNTEEKN